MQSDSNWNNITSSSNHPIMRGTNSTGGATRFDGPPRELRIPVRSGTSQGLRIKASALLNELSADETLIRIEYSGRLNVSGSSQIRIEQSPATTWEHGVNIWTQATGTGNSFTQIALITREQLQHATTAGTGDITLGASPANAELVITGIKIAGAKEYVPIPIPTPIPRTVYNMQTDPNWSNMSSATAHPIMRGTNSLGSATRVNGPPRELHILNRNGTSQGLRIKAGALLDLMSGEKITIEYSGRLNVAGSSQIRIEQSPAPTWVQGENIWNEPTVSGNRFSQTVTLTRAQLQHATTTGTGDITLGASPANAQLIITDIKITEIPTIYDMQIDTNWSNITSATNHAISRGTNSTGTVTRFDGSPRELRIPVRSGTSQGLRIRASALLSALSPNRNIAIEYTGRLDVPGTSQIRIEQSPAPAWVMGVNIWTQSTDSNNVFTQTVLLTRETLQHATTTGTGDITLGATPANAGLVITGIRIIEVPLS